MILLVILLIGTAAALGYGWYKTNEDKKDLEQATNQQGQELSGQLDKTNQDLAYATQQELTAANAKVDRPPEPADRGPEGGGHRQGRERLPSPPCSR